MNSAVLMIVFCRPSTTKQVFEAVRKAQPPRLYIASDAPRLNKDGEYEKCKSVIKIFESIDWPCKVHYFSQQKNAGCSKGPYDAITWFFEHENEGIILEDDIVPIPDFFNYCDEMLEKYRNNERIQAISGWSYFYKQVPSTYPYSYYFSLLTSSWGWATWKRVWKEMDLSLEQIQESEFISILENLSFPTKTKKLYLSYFRKIKKKYDSLQSWDYQFLFTMWVHKRLVIQPIYSMTKNIGFEEGATHYFDASIAEHPTKSIFPIKHPDKIIKNLSFDLIRINTENLYWKSVIEWKLVGVIKKIKRIINEF